MTPNHDTNARLGRLEALADHTLTILDRLAEGELRLQTAQVRFQDDLDRLALGHMRLQAAQDRFQENMSRLEASQAQFQIDMEAMRKEHAAFRREYEEFVRERREDRKDTAERLNALIAIADDLIRNRNRPPM
jgi:exonuclease VII small subunit